MNEKLIINNEEGASGNGASSANEESGKKNKETATRNEAATGNKEDSEDTTLAFKGIPWNLPGGTSAGEGRARK